MTHSTRVDYDSIILDCTAELKKFRGVVCELDMPKIDIDLFLGDVLPAVTNQKYVDLRLARVAHAYKEGDFVFEGLIENSDEELPNGVFDRLEKAVLQFGNDIKNKLEQNHAYRSGIFPYELKEYVNDGTVVFGKKNLSVS